MSFVISEILFVAFMITSIWLLIARKQLHKERRQQRDHAQKLKTLMQDLAFCYQQMQTISEQVSQKNYAGQQGDPILDPVSKRQVDSKSGLAYFDLATQLPMVATNTSDNLVMSVPPQEGTSTRR